MLILYSGIEIYFNESKEKNGIDYFTLLVKGIFKLLVYYGGRFSNYGNYFFTESFYCMYD